MNMQPEQDSEIALIEKRIRANKDIQIPLEIVTLVSIIMLFLAQFPFKGVTLGHMLVCAAIGLRLTNRVKFLKEKMKRIWSA